MNSNTLSELSSTEQNGNRNQLAAAFGLPDAPMLTTRKLYDTIITITELKSDASNTGMKSSIPRQDAYLITLTLCECPEYKLYIDGELVHSKHVDAGVTAIYDMKQDISTNVRCPFHCLYFLLPRKILKGISIESGAPCIHDLQHQYGVGIDDPIVRQLLLSLRPYLGKPDATNDIYVNYLALALSAHMAQTYGGLEISRAMARGGLAPWQERRAKELLSASLDKEVPLSQLAEECKLSVRHFARAFRQSTGIPPHRWRQKFRIQRAMSLLKETELTLSDIALTCGFSDQSHFTRVYSALTGTSPGAWRRVNSNHNTSSN